MTLGEALPFSGVLSPHPHSGLAPSSPEILGLSAVQLMPKTLGHQEDRKWLVPPNLWPSPWPVSQQALPLGLPADAVSNSGLTILWSKPPGGSLSP